MTVLAWKEYVRRQRKREISLQKGYDNTSNEKDNRKTLTSYEFCNVE